MCEIEVALIYWCYYVLTTFNDEQHLECLSALNILKSKCSFWFVWVEALFRNANILKFYISNYYQYEKNKTYEQMNQSWDKCGREILPAYAKLF